VLFVHRELLSFRYQPGRSFQGEKENDKENHQEKKEPLEKQ